MSKAPPQRRAGEARQLTERQWAKSVAHALTAWFREHGRVFPWREEGDPFWVLVAELLLRKTRAENAVQAYRELKSQLPAAADVAAAPLGDIERIVRPLGLPQRAAQIKHAAELSCQGVDIGHEDNLRAMHGVGEYITGAVRCLVAADPTPMVDGGVNRVISRLVRLEGSYEQRLRAARAAAALILQAEKDADPRAINLGLLDVAATICRPTPRCGECPLQGWCALSQARAQRSDPPG